MTFRSAATADKAMQTVEPARKSAFHAFILPPISKQLSLVVKESSDNPWVELVRVIAEEETDQDECRAEENHVSRRGRLHDAETRESEQDRRDKAWLS